MARSCPRARVLLAAPATSLAVATLLAFLAAPAAGTASAGGHALAAGYQVLVTSAPGGSRPAAEPARGRGRATPPALMLRLGSRSIVVPRPASGSFAVSALAHAGHGGPVTAPRHGRLHVLTVAGTNAAGQPDTGDQVLVGDVANSNAPGSGFGTFKNGTAKFSVPAGTYWAVAIFAQFSGHKFTSMRLDVLPQFKVAKNTTVRTAAAAATSKVTVATPRPAVTKSLSLTIVRAAPHAPANALSPKVDGLGEGVANGSLWINPVSQRPSYGTLRVFTSAQLTSPPGRADPYAYTLDFAGPPGTIPAQHFVAHLADLATITEDFVQDVRTVAGWQTSGGTPYQVKTGFIGGAVLPLRLPARQVQYVSTSPPMLWRTFYSEYQTIKAGQTPGGQADAFRLLHAGQRLTQTWGAYPLHAGSNVSIPGTGVLVRSSAARTGNTLSLDVTPFSDNQPGHLGDGLAVPFPGKPRQVSGSYAVYQNGAKIAGGNAVKATGGFGDVQVSAALAAQPAVIKFVLSASRASAQYHLSAASHDVWTWHSRPEPGATVPKPWLCNFAAGQPGQDRHCAVQPMMTLNYRVAGLSPRGSTGPGHQAVTVTAGHIQLAPQVPVTQAAVQVSFDGGKTWQRVEVRPLGGGRFRATFTAPPSAQVSLRTITRDAAGNGLTETILNAYQTRAA
jgi:hypothetical protein